ncbi:MAG: NUDIX domain-containing protein [Treponema sp.]|jgi:ADP-ribose pyrophosphatase YjhB (NUDIX family)|nr:NUDIX domain-containing protein [Treponema sp.]
MFSYCPSCASNKIEFKNNKVFKCPDCGFTYYHNTAAATGCVISSDDKVLLVVRAKDPGKGRYDLPGGFVDPGEGAVDALCREIKEELGWAPPPDADLRLFASFPNTYPYKGVVYNTCDLFFSLSAPGLTEKDLTLATDEIDRAVFLRPEEIEENDIAFKSARLALAAFFHLKKD